MTLYIELKCYAWLWPELVACGITAAAAMPVLFAAWVGQCGFQRLCCPRGRASENGPYGTKLGQPSAPQLTMLLGITQAAHGMLNRQDQWGQSPGGPCCWPLLLPVSYTQLCTFLAGKTIGADYQLEYGVDRIEMHEGHVQPGNKVLLIDDLIATGGTMAAGIKLMKQVDANIVEAACVIEMPDLKGRDKLDASKVPLFVLVEKEGA